jgi:hypothetical protein
VSERRGRTRAAPGRRRDQPTTPELESVIGDGDGEKDEGRGATAAEGNLAPRPTRDGLAAVAGPSVEAAEAVAFILAVVDEGKIIQNKRRERALACSFANEVFRAVASAAPPGVASPVPTARI